MGYIISTTSSTVQFVGAEEVQRHGPTAIASTEVDGCAASGEFRTFELDALLLAAMDKAPKGDL